MSDIDLLRTIPEKLQSQLDFLTYTVISFFAEMILGMYCAQVWQMQLAPSAISLMESPRGFQVMIQGGLAGFLISVVLFLFLPLLYDIRHREK